MRAKLASEDFRRQTDRLRSRARYLGNGGPGRACGTFIAVLRNHAVIALAQANRAAGLPELRARGSLVALHSFDSTIGHGMIFRISWSGPMAQLLSDIQLPQHDTDKGQRGDGPADLWEKRFRN